MLEKILENYNIPGKLIDVKENHSGNINDTFIATFLEESGVEKKYLIQKINTTVFTEPYKLMKKY